MTVTGRVELGFVFNLRVRVGVGLGNMAAEYSFLY